jgi:hypothetical protein
VTINPATAGTINNMSIGATTAASGKFSALTNTALTSGRVVYSTTAGLETDSANLTFDGTTLTANALTTTSTVTINGGTANGVAYLNASKVLTTGSALTWDTSQFKVTVASATSTANLVSSGSFGIRSGANSTLGAIIEGVDNTGAASYQPLYIGGSDLRFTNSGTEGMRLTSTGLGIGTSSPAQKLNVATASGNAYMRVERASQATGQVGLQIGGGTSSTDWLMYVPASSNTLTWFGNSTTLMSLDTSGNLGLGVTPSAWRGAFRVLSVGGAGASYAAANSFPNAIISANMYDDTTEKYVSSSNKAAKYVANGNAGQHEWYVTNTTGTAGNAITFTQAMTLQSTGYLKATGPNTMLYTGLNIHEFVGAAARVLNISSASASYTDQALTVSVSTAAGTGWLIFSGENTAGQAIKIYGNGNVQNSNNSYGAISDVKLKENITDASPKLADLMQVRVRNYNFKSDPDHKQLGVVAQELKQIFPNMIEESPDKDAEGNDLGTTTKGVKYSVFVPMLIKAMQEQQALIESLTARLNALENK